MTLLGKGRPFNGSAAGENELKMGRKLADVLKSFGIEAQITGIIKGPAATRFELPLPAGIRIGKIANLADDIALSMEVSSVRIIAPVPGKYVIGIKVPNKKPAAVRLGSVIDTDDFRNLKSNTALALGKDMDGNVQTADLAGLAHLLIAGAVGMGKSEYMHSLISSILYKADPNEVKLIMIDPRTIELSFYNGIPHLLIPVVTGSSRGSAALNWAAQEMMRRYNLFAVNNVRKLTDYNELAERSGERKLEQIIIIVDELADLMMVRAKEVEDSICRIAQLGHVVGMHLVVATQRPYAGVITGLIRQNIPSRIAFAVSCQDDSRAILDMVGAEKLLGKGDMLFLPMRANSPIRIQGAIVSDAELKAIVEFVKQGCTAGYDEGIMELIEQGTKDGPPTEETVDDMLREAIRLVVETGYISASLLQKRLKIGYGRASFLIDRLEEMGVIWHKECRGPAWFLKTAETYRREDG